MLRILLVSVVCVKTNAVYFSISVIRGDSVDRGIRAFSLPHAAKDITCNKQAKPCKCG